MSINVSNHLNFRGDARDALEFYRSVFGGDLVVITYEDAHNVQNPDESNQIMWGQVTADNGFRVMAYDVPSATAWDKGEIPFFVSVRGDSDDEISEYWRGLREGATIVQDLAPAGWASSYGMLEDRFGIVWVLDVVADYVPA